MAVTDAQKTAAEQVIAAIKSVTSPRKKRVLSGPFLELVDKDAWADYYQVLSNPRSALFSPTSHK
jgi:chromatin structure-remodeling complex subunit RSC1/2